MLPIIRSLGCLLLAALAPLPAQEPSPSTTAASPGPDAGPPTRVTLSGRAVTWTGQPIADAAVAFVDEDAVTTAELLEEPPQRTDAAGHFAIQVPARTDPAARRSEALILVAPGYAALQPRISWQYEDAPAGAPLHERARKDLDLGDIVLPPGARLFGRIRDERGKPLAGATVTATDMLDNHRQLRGQALGCRCRCVSDAAGIFHLPATLSSAVALDVSAPGFLRHQLQPVAQGTPLEITLRPGGRIQGRVLDEAGSGVDDALVSVSYERRGETSSSRSAADGSFELPLEYAGRYRVAARVIQRRDAQGEVTQQARAGSSPPLAGAQANLEIKAETASKEAVTATPLLVRAVMDATDAPVVDFTAAAVWEPFALNNASYLEYRMEMALRGSKPPVDGVAEVTPPSSNSSPTGIVRVLAAGCAPATRRDVEFEELAAGEAREPLVLRLLPESTIAGRVLDEESGEPVAGAAVWAVPRLDPNLGNYTASNKSTPEHAVRTGADGSFRIGQLGEGRWQLRVEHDQRPSMRAHSFEIGTAEHQTGLELRAPAGATVRGRITGMDIPQGTRVFLHELPRTTFSTASQSHFVQSTMIPTDTQALDDGGGFRFDGCKLGNFMLVLLLPSPPRCGGDLAIPIEPIRVRSRGIDRQFDASEDQPGRIEGHVTFAKAALPLHRIVVATMQIDPDPNARMVGGINGVWSGPRGFVQPDGTYSVGVAAGLHRLQLIDILTGLPLYSTDDPVESRAGKIARVDLTPELTELRVQLEPDAEANVDATTMALVDRLEVRFRPKVAQAGMAVLAGGNENYDQGIGVPIEGLTAAPLVLPEGSAILLARNNVTAVRVDKQRHNLEPLGRAEVEIDPQQADTVELVVKVGAAPEIPTEDEQGTDGKQDAKEDQKK